MRDLSDLIDILDDDVNVHLTDSTVGASSGMVCAISAVSSFGWVPFPGLLLVICLFVYSFIFKITFCRIFW